MNNHVSPAELDDILQAHPGVAECMVFGLPDPKVQELFSAAVVLKEEHKQVVCSCVLVYNVLAGSLTLSKAKGFWRLNQHRKNCRFQFKEPI